MPRQIVTSISFAVLCSLTACEAPPADSQSAEAPAPTSQEMPAPALIFPALNVLDLEATEAFYIDMLGMKVALRLGGEGDASQEVSLNFSGDVYAPEPSLLLHYKAERTEPYVFDAFSRIAFRVKDVDATVERIRAAGYRIISEPSMIKDTSIKLAFVEDPNGAAVELIEGMASAQELTGNP
jgi:lactoylglutathione lyase